MSDWPHTQLDELLRPFSGARGKLLELRDDRGGLLGNHGDALMNHCFLQLLPTFDIALDDDGGDLLIVPPNGALLDTYNAPALVQRWLERQADVPLVIFPSSAWFRRGNPAEMFGRRTAPTLWILREAESFRHLESTWGKELQARNVTLALDHDVVVTGRRFVEDLLMPFRREQTRDLLVARLGVEATNMKASGAGQVPSSLARRAAVRTFENIPDGRLKIALRRRVTRSAQQRANTEVLKAMPRRLSSLFQADTPDLDISDPTLADWKTYAERIANARLVVTNRLHVALPSAIMGADTFLLDSGYHKLRGVYERSLRGVDNIQILGAVGKH